MSDDKNVFENLRDDESRSEDSSEMGDSTADFFVDDREPIEDEAMASGQRPEDLGKVDTEEGQSVSIFNTSGPELEVRGKGSGQSVAKSGPKDGRIRGPHLAAVWPEGMEDRRGMRMGDLDSYQGTTVTGSTNQDRGGPRRPGGGEITTAEGLTDEPQAGTGHLTHALFPRTARLPPIRGSEQDGKTSGPKSSTEAKNLPRQSEWPKGKGGVKMEWESEDEEESDKELSEKDQWRADAESLDVAAEDAERELERALERCRAISLARSAHFAAGDEEGIARTRDALARGYAQDGNLVSLLLLDAEDQEALKFRPSDFVPGLVETWRADVGLFWRSKGTEFGKAEVMGVLDQATGLLKGWEEDLGAGCGAEVAAQLMERRALTEGLKGGKGVSPLAARLFPRESASEIMEWYLRLTSGLLEAQRLKGVARMAQEQLEGFVHLYPGPRFAFPYQGPNVARRGESQRGGRGSVLPRSEPVLGASVVDQFKLQASSRDTDQPWAHRLGTKPGKLASVVDQFKLQASSRDTDQPSNQQKFLGSTRGLGEPGGGHEAALMRGPESVQASRSPAEYGYDF